MEDLADLNFDLAVTLSPEAHHRALELTRTQAIDIEYWPMPDPTLAVGSREQIIGAYRDLRDRLGARLRERLAALSRP
jgi:protein-tyrosine-phosphatase